MTTPSFDKEYALLNKAQKEAVDTIEGSVMVIAGPGTGKTQVLTLRIANILLQSQVNPENILALTFTQSAVEEMRKRLVRLIGSSAYRVTITTFHGFCNDLIQQNPNDFSHLLNAESITEIEQIQIIENIIENSELVLLKPIGDPLYYVKPSLTAINELKKEGISVEAFTKAVNQSEEDFNKISDLYYEKGISMGKMKGKYLTLQKDIKKNKELITIYKQYQQALHTSRQYDFNDMLLETIYALTTNQDLLLRLQEQYQYILVDEHQDTNAAQNKIIEMLCNFYENPNLFVVGDEKQAIFRFQGASIENFLYFTKRYPQARIIHLVDNYRSSQIILNAAKSLIAHNPLTTEALSPKDLIAKASHPDIPIRILSFDDFHSEYYYLAKDIKEKLIQNVVPRSIAILGRNNRDIGVIAEVFEQQNIPFVLESEQNVLHDIDIQKFLLLFRTIADFGNESYITQAMHIDSFNIHPLDIYRLILFSKKEGASLLDIISDPEHFESLRLKDPLAISNLYQLLLSWKKASKNLTLDELFIQILKESQLLTTILNKKNSLIILDKFAALYDEVQLKLEKNQAFHLENFLHYIDLLLTHNISINASQKNSFKNGVRLMTAHKSKGLEFDYVYIINTFFGHWGNKKKRGSSFHLPWNYLTTSLSQIDTDENEDERRLFYVALTRAKKEVIVSFAIHNRDGKEQISSQFITEIEDKYRKDYDTTSFETEFLKHKEILLGSKPIQKEIPDEYLDNKELFFELFQKQGLSATGLNNFLQCPWRYFFRNLLELPDVKSESMIYGTAIHKALNMYLLHQNDINISLDLLLTTFTQAIEKTHMGKAIRERLRQQGIEELTDYYNQKIVTWPKNLMSEVVIRGVKFSDGITLNGRLDMIEPIHGTHQCIVHDFKTGRPKSKNMLEKDGQEGNYKRQLVFYKILLDRFRNGNMHMTKGAIDFTRPTTSGIFKTEYFDITQEDIQQVEEQIKNLAEAVWSFSFWTKRCEDKDCEYCLLRSYIN